MPFDNLSIVGSANRGGFVTTVDQLDRAKSELGMGYTLAASGVAVPLTGTIAETVLASVTVPGGLLGPNGVLRITSLWTMTNSANNKSMRVKFGGNYWQSYTGTALSQLRMVGVMMARGSEAAQLIPSGSPAFNDGSNTGAVATLAVDTTVDQTIQLAGALSSAAELITLEGFFVEVFPS